MPVPKIELRGVEKAFGANRVLRGVDLAVEQGRSLVVIGGSGTGKSVLLKLILGLLEPDGGEIRVGGRRGPADPRKIGMLFQGGALFDSLTVWENVAFALLHAHGVARPRARAVAVETLAKVGLAPDVALRRPAELSGGMQKRVALARAIAAEPEMLFFDEPTTGLDPIRAAQINALIVQCVQGLGATALTITHDMASVRAIAHDVAMLEGGQIIWRGPVERLDSPGDPCVEAFVHGRAESVAA
ncbi:MAG TPA: ABC transporter ATP-binding protein [Rhodospirillaceae bacterium]|nr:ABC transporter ATP-binding protein [Rhodospirillaceae bacterium]